MNRRNFTRESVLEYSSTAGQKCYFCDGKGICHVCDGTGTTGGGYTCSACNGSGRCGRCSGTGIMAAMEFVGAIGNEPIRN